MPRNRVGVEIDASSAQKHEDEPHTDSSRDLLDGSFSSRQLKATASAPSLEAAKAQRQKELLRKKKAERRAHAHQRNAEKQRRQDEKKQKRELLQMMDHDFPAVDPPKVLIDTSTSTQSLARLEVECKEEKIEAKAHDATTSASDTDRFAVEAIEGVTNAATSSQLDFFSFARLFFILLVLLQLRFRRFMFIVLVFLFKLKFKPKLVIGVRTREKTPTTLTAFKAY
ncbi:Inositol polyphosphate 5-phosphatase [Phytophthora cinnamomi]|uniref:Inositol polyphosphate 5-phosphatase n=1 Tax=Phytophthora cinnamomi TaxID=4785 RepID=UPI0035594B9F|nr:Inositol polyphosphate 5-phosphatase [Phytophthora cinnamomi]